MEERHSEKIAARACPVFKRCGACSILDMPYAAQLEGKESRIRHLFEGLCPESAFLPIAGMDDPYHYRNKIASPFAPSKAKPDPASRRAKGGAKGRMAKGAGKGRDPRNKGAYPEILTGMYARGTHELVPTDGCLVENQVGEAVVAAVRSLMRKWKIEPYDEDTGKGFMRHVIVRVGHNSGEVLVTLVTNSEEFPSSKSFCRELVKKVPAITTVVQNVNLRQTNVILGEMERTLYGPGFILDTLCGLSFRISSHSFYQVNAKQTEVLYDKAIEMARLDGDETVIDAYCGTGTIGLVAAQRGAGRVIGVDSVDAAIHDARENAKHNGIGNAEFIADDATGFLRGLSQKGLKGAKELVLMMDPPRAGSTPEFLDAAATLGPKRIVYISCNPETQVRDVDRLLKRGYSIGAVQPVDMFPHTDHIENIVLLEKS